MGIVRLYRLFIAIYGRPYDIKAKDIKAAVYFFFRWPISEIAWPIFTKLCHMFDGNPSL